MSLPLVSIIIPCYNAERWVAEAIQSCLDQTYSAVEIIVIDDGSTDKSLEIIKSFGDKIQWETGPNRGGNHARNRGFALSKGDYIQFLDADDYILPQKMERQVEFLEQSGADVVFGDWRHLTHLPNGEKRLQPVSQLEAQNDYLESLLSGWWGGPPASFLFRRSKIEASGSWDETLKAAQDRDFFITIVMAGARVGFQPGCVSHYRRYGAFSVSSENQGRWLNGHQRVLDKTRKALESQDRLLPRYRKALAKSYFALARRYFDIDRNSYRAVMSNVISLSPTFNPDESLVYNLIHRFCGFYMAELLASWKRKCFGKTATSGQEGAVT